MSRPPRNPSESLFNRRNVLLSLAQGTVVLAVVFAVFAYALYADWGEAKARALAFTTLIAANLSLIMTNRSWSRTIVETIRTPNTALWLVLGGAGGFMTLVLCVPFLRGLFRFEALSVFEVASCIGAGVLSIAWFEVGKLLRCVVSAKPASAAKDQPT